MDLLPPLSSQVLQLQTVVEAKPSRTGFRPPTIGFAPRAAVAGLARGRH